MEQPETQSAVGSTRLLAEVWVVNKTVSWEREIMGIYTDKAQADAHLDTLGPSAYITQHKLNERGSGHFC